MSYFQARSDLEFIRQFRADVLQLWELEDQAAEETKLPRSLLPRALQQAVQAEASKIAGYQEARDRVNMGVLRAIDIARRLGVPVDFQSIPPPAVGGVIIPVNKFYAVLDDHSHDGVMRQQVWDALTQAVGQCEAEVARQFRRLVNPLYWIRELLVFVIRIPFMLIQASGFDVSKVENHFLAKAIKLVELVLILYVLARLGAESEQFQKILMKLFSE